jgi:predicted CXXCH cytochrome family protein
MSRALPTFGLLVSALTWATGTVSAQQTVVGSPHDLSASGPGDIHALYEEEVCIFCHAPHNATGQRPLWNRHLPPTHYRIYTSSTTDARIDQPSGPSKMCLSCHDGALALGLLASRPVDQPVVMSRRTIPPGPTDLTQDLSDDHPIGFRFDRPLAARDGQLKNPDLVSRELPMGPHNEVHCTTCHDPHDNELSDFLRIADRRSAICLSCHDLDGWQASSHSRSGAAVTGRRVDPREPLKYHTVADNACGNCHKIHSAAGHERLLRFRLEEDNCLNCHSGGLARTNIAGDIQKVSAHRVRVYRGRHDPNEDPRLARRHVECVDCHNPHAAQARLGIIARSPIAGMGLVGPANEYVSGLDRFGRVVDRAHFEYDICFKCHADGINRPRLRAVTRQITQTNTRLEFQVTNPSFHPVIGPRNNTEVVSLRLPWRVGSIVRCTDCHNSDQAAVVALGGGSASGPHGSIYAPLLIDNYSTRDFTSESPRAYALCYRCHDRSSILADQSFPLHNRHVVRGRAPCSACHDAHGISRRQGNSRNNSNLINFDRSIVQSVTAGGASRILFEDTGSRSGSCTLRCHNVVHVQFRY